jgi:hypothetical protein
MVPVSEHWFLQVALERLRTAIQEQNRPGSVDGLLANHILSSDPYARIEWNVVCSSEWMTAEFKPTNLECVSALGYSMWLHFRSEFVPQLKDGLERVMSRDPFSQTHPSLVRNPSRLLGLVLGALALRDNGRDFLSWCRELLDKAKNTFSTGAQADPLHSYVRHHAFGEKVSLDLWSDERLYVLSFYDWIFRQGVHKEEPSLQQLSEARAKILFLAATDLQFEATHQAAFIWTAVNFNLFHALKTVCLQARDVAIVLENFESATKRWRWDKDDAKHPVRWPINQEREVQDILWLILRSYFPDVVDEDTLPKLGHSSYRADFGIPSLKLIIEAKFAGSREDFKKIEKEIIEDSVPYLKDLRYESIIVFVYDASASVQEHDTTKAAMLSIPGVSDVVIVSRPSQLAEAHS